ncbi:outer membrane lipoprotein carrier protein LolA [Streptomyces sp. NPDC001407]|uniref:LolA family protein n=1 Tax=unclassified Streptomyces TaxID=2593676 RepID=UPI0033F16339
MARNELTESPEGHRTPGRRKAVRYAVPVAVAGLAAGAIGLVPALAKSGDPDLPKISAEDLIAKVAKSDVQQMSGSVKVTTDLGLPSLPGGASFGSLGGGHGGKAGGADVSPQAKLTELASGSHTLRVAVDGPDKQRVSIVESAAEYSVIRNGDQVWAYDSGSNTVHHSTAPRDKGDAERHAGPEGLKGASPQELAKKALAAVDDSTAVSVDGTAKVAGRDAYQLVVKPKAQESTVGAVRIAVDAKTGVPLKFTLSPKSGGKAAIDAAFTKVDFAKPGASTFDFTPPKGAKVTEDKADAPKQRDHKGAPAELSGLDVVGKSWTSIAQFKMPADAAKGAKDAKGGSLGKNAGGAGALLDTLGTKVSGPFGSGHVFSTRIVNVLMTDDGHVYAGAVTKEALVKAAK